MIVTLDGLTVSNEPSGTVKFKLTDLDGWYSSPPVRLSMIDLPLADGGFNPVRSYRSIKRMSLQGVSYGGTSAEAIAQAWQMIAALSPDGLPMLLTVTDELSTKSMRVWLRDPGPQVLPFASNRARFSIPIAAIDPRKYGPESMIESGPAGDADDGLTFPLFADGYLDFGDFAPSGLFYITNDGTAESWPIFRVRGGIDTGFQILSAQQVLEYSAAVAGGSEVTLSPYAGGRASLGATDVTYNLTRSEWPSIQPGETRLYVFNTLGATDGNARLTTLFSAAWW